MLGEARGRAMTKHLPGVAALTATCVFFAMTAAMAEDRVSLQSRPGVAQPILYQAAASPVASVILFTGGNGVISATEGNFLLRVRAAFPRHGISVAVIDAPSDQPTDTPRYRASADAAADIAAVIAFLKAKAPAPVWLVGTSKGSISAANGAARLGPSQVGGLVLTSAVWAGGMQRVSLGAIATPTLVIHNRDDACPQSPPAAAEPGLAMLTNAPTKELLWVSGGESRGDACEAHSPHGYFGVESKVVPPLIDWIENHTPVAPH